MNDFFESLKDIKKEMIKEQGVAPKKEVKKQAISKEEAIAHKEQMLRDEFMKYIKDSDIKKI